jgi:hypothetical protein
MVDTGGRLSAVETRLLVAAKQPNGEGNPPKKRPAEVNTWRAV